MFKSNYESMFVQNISLISYVIVIGSAPFLVENNLIISIQAITVTLILVCWRNEAEKNEV